MPAEKVGEAGVVSEEPTYASSIRALSIPSCTEEERREIAAILKAKNSNRVLVMVKLMLLVALPVVALIAVMSVTVSAAETRKHMATKEAYALTELGAIDELVTCLQIERGLSATVLIAPMVAILTL